ncbi:hypothetical protein AB0K93_31110, partial [Streptomyces sp. NPDC052676]|uniref:hypothetical protein n=1 Tax=Streptomyces sp. NPDC052676 TaxID=3154953 RepID=UPI003413F173
MAQSSVREDVPAVEDTMFLTARDEASQDGEPAGGEPGGAEPAQDRGRHGGGGGGGGRRRGGR